MKKTYYFSAQCSKYLKMKVVKVDAKMQAQIMFGPKLSAYWLVFFSLIARVLRTYL